MKKTAVLLAGLLLVTGTVFAEGWEVTGAAVEGTLNVIDTENGMNMSAGDANLSLEMVKEGDFGKLTTSYTFDKDGDTGTSLDLAYTKTEGDFTVGLGATIDFTGDDDSSSETATNDKIDASSSVAFSANENADTYLAWQVMGSEDMKLTVYPYEVDGISWDNDTFESFATSMPTNAGGFAFEMKLAEETTATAKWVITDNTTGSNTNTFKGEVSTKVSDVSIDAFLGLVPENTDATQAGITAMGAKASMTMDSLTINGEFNTETIGDADAKVGIFAKASLAMDEMNGYTPTAYASFTNLNDQVDTAAGATTEIEAGVKLAQGSFYVTPKLVLKSADNDVYDEEETGADATNSATTVGVSFGYSM